MPSKPRSPLWYELPLLFYFVGGIISFLLIRDDDPVKAKRCLVLGIILTTISLLLVGGMFILIGSNSTFVIASNSMTPVILVNDVVVVDDAISFEKINLGDIIAFNRPSDHNKVIVHRVVTILEEDPKTLRTKGDANTASIPGTDFPITEEEYVGKIVNVMPNAGTLLNVFKPPMSYLILIISLLILIIPVILHIRFRKNMKKTSITEN